MMKRPVCVGVLCHVILGCISVDDDIADPLFYYFGCTYNRELYRGEGCGFHINSSTSRNRVSLQVAAFPLEHFRVLYQVVIVAKKSGGSVWGSPLFFSAAPTPPYHHRTALWLIIDYVWEGPLFSLSLSLMRCAQVGRPGWAAKCWSNRKTKQNNNRRKSIIKYPFVLCLSFFFFKERKNRKSLISVISF